MGATSKDKLAGVGLAFYAQIHVLQVGPVRSLFCLRSITTIAAVIAAGVAVARRVVAEVEPAAVFLRLRGALPVDAAGAGRRWGSAQFGGAGDVTQEGASG